MTLSERIWLLPENGHLYKANLHCHSTFSDGKFSPEELKQLYMRQGYHAIAYTDHQLCVPHPELTDDNFVAFTGLEIAFGIKKNTSIHVCGISRNPMEYMKIPNDPHNDAFHALLEKYPSCKPYIRSNCLDYYFGHISDFAEPFPEQIEVIKKLRESGVKTALVTNVTSERIYSQKKKIEVLGLESLFDCIVLSGELGIHKPDRGIFDYTAKLLGVSSEECVFVGDDPDSDISGALNADMEAVWIDREEYDGTFSGEPRVYRVKSVYEYFNF